MAQKDVTAAVAALTSDLQIAFKARLLDPGLVTDGATVFPDTGVLGTPVPSVDPATLVGQEIATFDLSADGDSGTVIAVKTAPCRRSPRSGWRGAWSPATSSWPAPVQVKPTRPSSARARSLPGRRPTARQVAVLDADEVRAAIVVKLRWRRPRRSSRDSVDGTSRSGPTGSHDPHARRPARRADRGTARGRPPPASASPEPAP